jgi:hypothetical protein
LFALDPVPGTPGLLLQSSLRVFIVGCFGAAFGDVLALAETRKEAMPEYARRAWYWIGACLYALLGGGIAVLYGTGLNAILVFNVGTSIPLIAKSASTSAKRLRPLRID